MEAPQAKGHFSVVRLTNHWYVAASSEELSRGPLARTVLGVPLVLFRKDDEAPAALLDRCPHRNVPLSAGAVTGGQLECRYHGWRFDGTGACRRVPVLGGEPEARARRVPAHPCVEQDGFVWVFGAPDVTPQVAPYRFPLLGERGYATVRRSFTVESTMHAAVENTLDVPHTAFLHRGLFRKERPPTEITAVVRAIPGGVEAEYVGEPRPPGLAGRLLAPGGGVVTHFDRFLLPCIAQVEYRLGSRSHLLVTTAFTPESDFVTRIHATVTFRLPVPAWLVRPVLTPIAIRIFGQDADILKLQTATTRRFGGEQFVSTAIDVLGPRIWRLLRQEERGVCEEPGAEERVSLWL